MQSRRSSSSLILLYVFPRVKYQAYFAQKSTLLNRNIKQVKPNKTCNYFSQKGTYSIFSFKLRY